MKKVLMVMGVMVLCGSLVAAQEASAPASQPVKKESPAAAQPKPATKRCIGSVGSTDVANNTIAVKLAKDKVVNFNVAGVKITKDNKEIALADISAGNRVSVAYEGKLDNAVVKSVKVLVEKAQPKKVGAKPKAEVKPVAPAAPAAAETKTAPAQVPAGQK